MLKLTLPQKNKKNKFKFGKTSIDRLLTCHPDLVMIVNYALKTSPLDFAVICGHRGEKEQNKAYDGRFSRKRFPDSNHNKIPSIAVDLAPYPIDWNNIANFKKLGEHIKKISNNLGVEIAWGGEWISPKDYPHFELKNR